MPKRVGLESKILEYFKTAPVNEARLLFGLVAAEVKSREALLVLPAAKKSKKAGERLSNPRVGEKRGRPRKDRPNGVEQPGQAVPIEAVLGQAVV